MICVTVCMSVANRFLVKGIIIHAAGYNHLDVVEYLLERGADVNAKDKGGLIPLHNASSFGVRICQYITYICVYYLSLRNYCNIDSVVMVYMNIETVSFKYSM